MKKKRKTVITNSKEIYDSFNTLNFKSEVILKDVKIVQLKKILKNINRPIKILDMVSDDKKITIKKINPLNFNIYMSK